ncbi:MAG: thioredoxin fold domain-containing protein [Chitinophagaceae bacterium]|nr:thioredoxin fold domain-containing protein [Chitinophagaceae bacterium]
MKLLNPVINTILFSVLILSCTAQTKNSLTAAEFEKEITTKENIQILDVRTPGEFFSGHIKTALQADWNNKAEFERRLAFVDKNKPVYIYCLAGGRSAAAANKMRSMGYQAVIELQGGTNAWRAANLPLEGSSNEKQMTIEALNETIAGSKTVLIDFGAPWCPPCKQMEPVLASLKENNKGKFTFINVDGGRDQDILKTYEVTALPVFIVFKDGKQVWRKDGVVTEKELADQIH